MKKKQIKKLRKKADQLLREIEILTAVQQMAVDRFNDINHKNELVKRNALDTIAEINAIISVQN